MTELRLLKEWALEAAGWDGDPDRYGFTYDRPAREVHLRDVAGDGSLIVVPLPKQLETLYVPGYILNRSSGQWVVGEVRLDETPFETLRWLVSGVKEKVGQCQVILKEHLWQAPVGP